jgi:hypothetical protein
MLQTALPGEIRAFSWDLGYCLRASGQLQKAVEALQVASKECRLAKDKVILDEAWQIAERGPMRLPIADIHIYRARLFFGQKPYPWNSHQAGLAAARI